MGLLWSHCRYIHVCAIVKARTLQHDVLLHCGTWQLSSYSLDLNICNGPDVNEWRKNMTVLINIFQHNPISFVKISTVIVHNECHAKSLSNNYEM